MDESKGDGKMKEKAKMDTWLRNQLDDYRPLPAESSRERFLSGAPASSGSGSSNTVYVVGILLLMIISSVSIYVLSSEQSSALKYYPAIRSSILTSSLNGEEKKTSDLPGQYTESNITNETFRKSLEYRTYGKLTGDNIKNNLLEINQSTGQAINENNTPELNTDIQQEAVVTEIQPVVEIPEPVINEQNIDSAGVNLSIPSKNDKRQDFEPYNNRLIFLYYRPEYLWNIIENEKLVHNFGLEWQKKLFNGRYTLGTGLGLSLNKGYYEYAVDYNEYLGNYQQLDSITFNWDPEDFVMQYNVHTSEETVYDTAVKTHYERIYRRFVYLQIPLTLGYDFIKTGRSSLGFRFVPVLSLLLSKKPVDFRYDAGNNRIIQINRITADRVNSNWQLNSGLVYGRQLNESLRLEIEPRFTYYFNSVFEKSDNSVSPMGASIRIALGIRY